MEPIVTVMIVTYNHEKYIKKALESVLSQKIEYPFEIIVHDDSSLDGTQKIIRECIKGREENISLAFEDENQYSKGIIYFVERIKSLCKRKYTIILEGDDYWCDEYKLQKQVKYLEEHPDALATTHRCELMRLDLEGNYYRVGLSPARKVNDSWNIEEIIDWKDVYHTTSILFRTEWYASAPKEVLYIAAGDWRNAVWACAHGKIHYMPEIMSSHLLYSDGSYSQKNFGTSVYSHYEDIFSKRQKWCDDMDKVTDYKYTAFFVNSQNRRWGQFLWNSGKYKEALDTGFHRKNFFYKRVIMYIYAYIPLGRKIYDYLMGHKYEFD